MLVDPPTQNLSNQVIIKLVYYFQFHHLHLTRKEPEFKFFNLLKISIVIPSSSDCEKHFLPKELVDWHVFFEIEAD